jgi:hypothetical protein
MRCFITISFQLSFKYAIRKIQENKESVELNGTHQLLVYDDDDDVNLLSETMSESPKSTSSS